MGHPVEVGHLLLPKKLTICRFAAVNFGAFESDNTKKIIDFQNLMSIIRSDLRATFI